MGTGLSTRLRGQENDFALLDVAQDEVAVTRMIARDGAFAEAGVRRFVYGDEGWKERRDTMSAEPAGTVRDPAALRH